MYRFFCNLAASGRATETPPTSSPYKQMVMWPQPSQVVVACCFRLVEYLLDLDSPCPAGHGPFYRIPC